MHKYLSYLPCFRTIGSDILDLEGGTNMKTKYNSNKNTSVADKSLKRSKTPADEFKPIFKVAGSFDGNPFSCRSCKCHPSRC